MKINWKVRLKNKYFWFAIIPAVLLLVNQVLAIFGVSLDLMLLQEQLLAVAGTAFTILTIIGVVVDPTTDGISDSTQAMTYDKPKVGEPSDDSGK